MNLTFVVVVLLLGFVVGFVTSWFAQRAVIRGLRDVRVPSTVPSDLYRDPPIR